jgi:RNA polymerase sigma factor (sigma-70 family)
MKTTALGTNSDAAVDELSARPSFFDHTRVGSSSGQGSAYSLRPGVETAAPEPLLTSVEEAMLGHRCMRLSTLLQCRVSLAQLLGREPSAAEWARAGNVTARTGGAASGSPASAAAQDAALERALERELEACRLAKEKLVNANLRLVVSIARRYQNIGVGLQDLVQEGSLGLIRAAEKYDPTRGFRFSTYASWWVQQAVFRSVAFHSRTIRLPMHVHNLLNKARAVRKEMAAEGGGAAPTNAALAARLGLPLDKLEFVLEAGRGTLSSSQALKLQAKRGSGSGASFETAGSIEDGGGQRVARVQVHEEPEEYVEGAIFRSEMSQALSVLNEDERFVLALRYGLGVQRRHSMAQIAEIAGTGKVWVKKMEQRALRKLRRPHHQMKLRPFSSDGRALEEAVHDQDRVLHYAPTKRPAPGAAAGEDDGGAEGDGDEELPTLAPQGLRQLRAEFEAQKRAAGLIEGERF